MRRSIASWLFVLAVVLVFEKPRTHWPHSIPQAKIGTCECSTSVPPLGADQMVFYVATNGNDSWSGKLDRPNARRTDGPFLTLQRAQKAVRDLKTRGPLREPATVYIRGGQYELAQPLVFTPEDSGTSKDPVTYAAYPGETPVLSGGREITGWKRATDKRLVAQAGGELWMAHVPGVKEGKWFFHELFVDGDRRQRARTPNTGFFHVDGKVNLGKQAQFKFHQGDIRPSWAAQPQVEIVILQAWAELRMYIRNVNNASHTVILSGTPSPSNRENDARYWVENTRDALDAPGEWYLDRANGFLYYRPEPGEKMNRVQAIAPVLTQLVRFEGHNGEGWVHNIRLHGLTLSYTDWSMGPSGYADLQAAYDVPAAVEGMGTRACSIERCILAHLGGYAVAFGGGSTEWWGIRQGSKRNCIVGNNMYDLGAGGVKIGDPKDPNSEGQATDGNIVSDNHIHNIGLVYPAAVGIWVGQSSDNIISHNEINDTFYTGISVGWTWGYGPTAAHGNLIEFNNIHDISRGMLSDLGCIYTLGVQHETVERNNVCHDVSRYKYGGWGIYTDEGSSDIVIENNVVYRTQDEGFHQNYGENNIVRNNIFAYGKEAQVRRSHSEPHLSFDVEHNIFYWNSGPFLNGKWDDNEYHFDHNLYYRADDQSIEFMKSSFVEWQARGQDRHSLIADPRFVDPSKGDFSLQPGSPAVSIGFRPIDLSCVGPR